MEINWHTIDYAYRCNIDAERVIEFLRVECERSSQEYVRDLLGVHRSFFPKLFSGEVAPSSSLVSRIISTYNLPLKTFQLFSNREILLLSICYFKRYHRIQFHSEIPRKLYFLMKHYNINQLTKRINKIFGYNIICADQTFTDRELLTCLKNFFFQTGRVPMASEHKLAPTIIQRFAGRRVPFEYIKKYVQVNSNNIRLGAWNKALILAGIPIFRVLTTEESSRRE